MAIEVFISNHPNETAQAVGRMPRQPVSTIRVSREISRDLGLEDARKQPEHQISLLRLLPYLKEVISGLRNRKESSGVPLKPTRE